MNLIDKAAKVCGSYGKLATALDITPVAVHQMRYGKRSVSPLTAAELAEIAGEDPQRAALDALVESARGTRREAKIREILGNARQHGGGEVLRVSYKINLSDDVKRWNARVNPIYIVLNLILMFWRSLRAGLWPTVEPAYPPTTRLQGASIAFGGCSVGLGAHQSASGPISRLWAALSRCTSALKRGRGSGRGRTTLGDGQSASGMVSRPRGASPTLRAAHSGTS